MGVRKRTFLRQSVPKVIELKIQLGYQGKERGEGSYSAPSGRITRTCTSPYSTPSTVRGPSRNGTFST